MRGSTRRVIFFVLMVLTVVLAGFTECDRSPEQTCSDLCRQSQPSECSGASGMVMVTERGEEEPLAVGSSWMCGCPSQSGELIMHLTPRRACRTPRGWTADDITKRAPSDD